MRGLSGLRLLPEGPTAYNARIALARQATHSLDVQYYFVRMRRQAGENSVRASRVQVVGRAGSVAQPAGRAQRTNGQNERIALIGPALRAGLCT